jgi:hypothetical protein
MKNMFKKFVVLLASLGLIFQLTGCTSKDSKGDGEEMAIDGTDSAATADVEKVEGEQNLDIAADDSASSASSNALPEEALGETVSTPAKDVAPGVLPMQDLHQMWPLQILCLMPCRRTLSAKLRQQALWQRPLRRL